MKWSIPLVLAVALCAAVFLGGTLLTAAPVTVTMSDGTTTETILGRAVFSEPAREEIPGAKPYATGFAWGVGLSVLFLWRPATR